jgi:2,3-dihydroxy-p-cumate/2,3-dihydroxybenzoate 3,4-dioxygenase
MINLHDICYVRLGTADLDHAVQFAGEILGLQPAGRGQRTAQFRADDRAQTLTYIDGDPSQHVVGFELRTLQDLEAAAAELDDAGHRVTAGTRAECDDRAVRTFINVADPTGTSIDLAVGPAREGSRYYGSRDAGITSFSHVGLYSTNPQADEKFWTGTFSARVSDRVGDAALLRIDEVHHKGALFPAQRSGIQHVNHQVASIDDVMRSYYFLCEQGVKIRFGPGRHPTSGAVFLYFVGPDGMTYEYSTGVRLITDEAGHQPRQFPMRPSSGCSWGSKAEIPEFPR